MLRSMPPRWIETHGSSLNSFCGWKASFLPALPKIRQHQDRDRQVDAEPDEDLVSVGLHARRDSRLARRLRARRGGRAPAAAKETVKRTTTRIAAARPASRSASRPTSRTDGRHQPDAAEGRRGDRRPSPSGGCRRRAPRLARRVGERPGSRAARARRRRRRRSRASAGRRARKPPERRPGPAGRRTWEET